MKKFFTVVAIVVGSLVAVIAIGLGTTSTINAVASTSEMDALEPYGQLVEVNGKNMNVVIRGDGEQTVVLLPGFATAAPALDFEPLIAQLESDYRVVAVEPFGYGLSDVAGTPRTSANIAAEVHDALRALDIDRYVLMGHSIAGIYALEYIATYPDEVSAFVGIDSSVPGQPGAEEPLPIAELRAVKDLGLFRVLGGSGTAEYDGLAYSEQMKEQMVTLTNRNSYGPDIESESDHFAENFTNAKSQSFPVDLPLLLFVMDDGSDPGWIELHEGQVGASNRGEMVLLSGDHYLHHTQSKAIAEKFAQFMTDVVVSGGAPAS